MPSKIVSLVTAAVSVCVMGTAASLAGDQAQRQTPPPPPAKLGALAPANLAKARRQRRSI